MATRVVIEDSLIEEALRLGGHKSKEEAATYALREYIRRHKRQPTMRLLGNIEFKLGFDNKKVRARP